MNTNEMEIDVAMFNHATIALWVGDFKRSKNFLERFSKIARKSMHFNITELKSTLRRPPKKEVQEIKPPDVTRNKNELFIYGPLLIRAENLLDKISNVDVRSIEEEIKLIETQNFSFRVDEVGINVYELKGYSHRYPLIKIRLDNLESRLREKFQPEEGDMELIDRDEEETPDSLTFQLTMQQPMVYAQFHMMRNGIIYGEIHTRNRKNAERVSQYLFEELEEAVQKHE